MKKIDIFNKLRSSGLRPTKQRLQICEVLFNTDKTFHFTINELEQKIKNIGHSDLVEKAPFYQLWQQVDLSNYKEMNNFKTSGLGGAQWPKLEAIPLTELENYIKNYVQRAY